LLLLFVCDICIKIHTTKPMHKFYILIFITFLMHTFGCRSVHMEESLTKHFTCLTLGDSYTIGEGVTESERYPVQLRDRLVNAGIHLEKVQIIARTGWTTDELMAGISNAETDSSFSVVNLLIGVNNQYRGRSLDNYRAEFVQLLTQAIEFADGDASRVVVLSIPDWGVTPFAEGRDRDKIATEIDAFNKVNKAESLAAGVGYVDVTAISRRASNQTDLIAADGLHPSARMYTLWVEELLPVVLQILNKNH
jgi:lysophospholipase L1-like esterase